MSYSLQAKQIVQDVFDDGGSDGPPGLASDSGSDSEPETAGRRASARSPPAQATRAASSQAQAAGANRPGGAAAPSAAAAAAGGEDSDDADSLPGLANSDAGSSSAENVDSELELGHDLEEESEPPDMISDESGSGSDDDAPPAKQPPRARPTQPAQQQLQHKPAPQQALRAPQRQQQVAKPKVQKKAKAPKAAGGSEEDVPGLVSEDEDSGEEGSEDEAYPGPQGRRQQQPRDGGAPSPFSSDEDDEWGDDVRGGAARRGKAAQQQRRSSYSGLGSGQREDLRGAAGAAGRAAAAQPPPASQFAEAQSRQRRPKPPPAPVAVEKVEAQVAEDEALKAALKMEEEERKALRKKMGLEEDEEAEVEDPVLGLCAYGDQCTRDPEEHHVKTSHTDRYEFRCSAGHKIFYHQPCWRKAEVRLIDAKGEERLVIGKDYKWPKKAERKKCIDPSCEGIIIFIEAPNKYNILNIEEEVKEEMEGKAVEEEEPEWERYKREQELEKKDRRFRFKKGRGRKEEEEEEPAAPQTGGRAARAQQDQQPQLTQQQEQQPQASAAAQSAAAAAPPAEEQAEEPAATTPALPDDRLLQAFKRDSSDEELLTVGLARRARDRGKAPAREAEIVYEDSKPDKRKKKGVKLLVGGLSVAEQRERQRKQAVEADLEAREQQQQRPQDLGVNVMDFPDLEEAQLLGKERPRGEDAERLARDRQSAATLSALRSFKAGEFRPDDPSGPATLLVENVDFRRIKEEEGARPEMYLRSTFAEYGPVKDLRMYEPCKAAVVSFRSTAAAYKAYMLLSQKVLLHSKLTTLMLRRLPREEEVSAKAEELLEEAERREAEGDSAAFAFEADDWAAGPSTSAPAAAFAAPAAFAPRAVGRAPLYADTAPAFQARSVSTGAAAGPRYAPSVSITIPGAAAATAAAAAGGSAGPGSAVGSLGTPTNGGLRVGAAEFRPGSSGAAAAALPAQQAQQDPGADALALASKYLSAQLVAASQETYQAYLQYKDQNFGLPISQLDRPGVIMPDQIALLMVDQAAGMLYGLWSAVQKETLADYGEVVAFKQQHIMHPLPLDRVEGLLARQGLMIRLPQKVPAATAAAIMRAFAEHERERRPVEQAQQAAATALAGPPPPPPAPRQQQAEATQQQQQQQQAQQGQPAAVDEWWREEERRRREQEEKDAEIARQLQEQLLAEAQLEEQRRIEEDRRLAAALRDTTPAPAPAPPPPGMPAGYAAVAAARPAMPAPAPFRPPGIFSSLFPGQRPPSGAGAAPAAPMAPAAASSVPAVAAGGVARAPSPTGNRPAYRPPVGYRPPGLAPAAAAPAAPPAAAPSAAPPSPAMSAPAAVPSAPAAPAAPPASAPPAVAPAAPAAAAGSSAAAAPAPPEATAAAAQPTAPAQAPLPPPLKDPCVLCKQRESVNIWIPCGHRGHCEECLPDRLSLDEKLAQFPKCLVCSAGAQYYLRMFT
ncbi:hypothetical protein ABPG75_008736 [Micractinium tetrahymenae]